MKLQRWATCLILCCVSAACGQGKTGAASQPANASGETGSSRPCGAAALEIRVPTKSPGGTLELLSPIMDTDGMEQRVYPAQPSTCVPLADLQNLRRRAGLREGESLALEIRFDPEGTSASFRERLDYEPDIADAIPRAPVPPREMRFAEGAWDGGSRINVRWHEDFRAHLQREYPGLREPGLAHTSFEVECKLQNGAVTTIHVCIPAESATDISYGSLSVQSAEGAARYTPFDLSRGRLPVSAPFTINVANEENYARLIVRIYEGEDLVAEKTISGSSHLRISSEEIEADLRRRGYWQR